MANAITEARVGASIRGPFLAAMQKAPEEVPPILSSFEAYVERVARVVMDFESAATGIESNPRLSPEGIAEELRDLAVGALGKIGRESDLPRVIENGRRNAQEIRKRIGPPPSPEDANASTMASDIRAHVKGLGSEMDRTSFLRENAGDPTVAGAVLSAPAFLSGLTPEQHERFRTQALHAKRPEMGVAIDLIEKVIKAAQDAARNAEAMVAQRAGIWRAPGGTRWMHRLEHGDGRVRMQGL